MDKCPTCGSDAFEVQYRVSGKIVVRERPNGSAVGMDNTGMWDDVTLTRTRRKKRCCYCNTVIKET